MIRTSRREGAVKQAASASVDRGSRFANVLSTRGDGFITGRLPAARPVPTREAHAGGPGDVASTAMDRTAVARQFIDAFGANDLDAVSSLLAEGFVGHITNADGSTRDVGRDDYVASVESMDVPTANLRLDVPDVSLVGDDQVMAMVEVHAERNGRTLHNHSGQLLRVVDDHVTELWMVDALPAESDAFWSA